MKRGILAFLCATIFLCVAIPAQAREPENAELTGVYAGVKFIDSYQTMWPTILGTTYYYSQNTFGGALFAGYDFYPQHGAPVRAEFEYAARSSVDFSEAASYGGDSIKAEAKWGLQTLFLNVYADWHNNTDFTPYIGVGVGAGLVSTEYKASATIAGQNYSAKSSSNNTVLAANFGLLISALLFKHIPFS